MLLMEQEAKSLPSEWLEQLLRGRGFDSVAQELSRAVDNITEDPPTAITAACAIIEALLKRYIKDNNIEMPTKQSIKPLWKTVYKHLELDPGTRDDDQREEGSVGTEFRLGRYRLLTYTSWFCTWP